MEKLMVYTGGGVILKIALVVVWLIAVITYVIYILLNMKKYATLSSGRRAIVIICLIGALFMMLCCGFVIGECVGISSMLPEKL